MWRELFDAAGRPRLLRQTGVLWLAREADALVTDTLSTLRAVGVPVEELTRAELERRYPQFDFGAVTWGLYEPEAGVLLARRAVRRVFEEALKGGCEYLPAAVAAPAGRGRLDGLSLPDGTRVSAGVYVFACGPWLPRLFPDILGERIHATRQEVFFFGTPPGDARFSPPLMPVWIDFGAEVYAVPDLEGRGFKLALDRHGPAFEPRRIRVASAERSRRCVACSTRVSRRCGGALVESRVCQYENTSNGDFLIDRPRLRERLVVGGGYGHGFKHGTAVGEFVAELIDGRPDRAAIALAAKEKFRRRAIY